MEKERKEDVYIQIRLHVYKGIYGSSDCSIHMVRHRTTRIFPIKNPDNFSAGVFNDM